jgi:hypothetical protein
MNECIEESILLLKLTMNFLTLARKVIQARNAQWQYQETVTLLHIYYFSISHFHLSG